MAIGCPWDGWAPGNLQFCERELCSWVREPAGTWSNVGFVLVGIWLGLRLRRERAAFGPLHLIPVAALMTGVTSTLFHASKTWFFQLADLGSMYLLSVFLLLANLRRLGWLAASGRFAAAYAAGVAGSIGLMAVTRSTGIEIFAVEVTAALAIEGALARGVRADYRPLLALLGTFGAALAFWVLDRERIACDPDNHGLNGHAAWHLINALSFVWVDRFYRGARRA